MNTEASTVTREERRNELASTTFSEGLQGGSLMQPSNGRELMDMANLMSNSGQMVRDFYRGNAGDCAALIMICQPYGLNPYMVSWKTYKASKNQDAPVSFEAQLINAMVNISAPVQGRLKYKYEGEGERRTCTVIGIDRENGEEITYTTPEIGKIGTKNSPLWRSDPDQQLGYFAARSWARRHFPELLLGVYARDEMDEEQVKDVTPKEDRPNLHDQIMNEKPAQEAEVVESIDIDTLDYSDHEVGSEAFTQGVKDYGKGLMLDNCPFDGVKDAIDWKAGYMGASEADTPSDEEGEA